MTRLALLAALISSQALAAVKLAKLLGLMLFRIEQFRRKVREAQMEREQRQWDEDDARRLEWLRTLDADEVRRDRDLGSIILAGQIEAAKRTPPADWGSRLHA